jgi:choline kinase
MKIILTEGQVKKIIIESYKITLNDKKNIEKHIRDKYEQYIKQYEDAKNNLKLSDIIKNNISKSNDFSKEQIQKLFIVLDDNHKSYEKELNRLKSKKHDGPMLYNEFYHDNHDKIKNEYIRRVSKNNIKKYNIPDLGLKKFDSDIVDEIKNSLTNDERINVKKFLRSVEIRQSSGTGESISKRIVRDLFFQTPISFQKLYSVKPNKWLWRGDDYHPCDINRDNDDPYDKYMQSFSEWKSGAKDFGAIIFNAMKIKKYGGSFSLSKYLNNEMFDVDFGDDEGEIMFFDVEYGCNKKFEKNF